MRCRSSQDWTPFTLRWWTISVRIYGQNNLRIRAPKSNNINASIRSTFLRAFQSGQIECNENAEYWAMNRCTRPWYNRSWDLASKTLLLVQLLDCVSTSLKHFVPKETATHTQQIRGERCCWSGRKFAYRSCDSKTEDVQTRMRLDSS